MLIDSVGRGVSCNQVVYLRSDTGNPAGYLSRFCIWR